MVSQFSDCHLSIFNSAHLMLEGVAIALLTIWRAYYGLAEHPNETV